MPPVKSFSDYLNSSKFIRTLLIAIQPIYVKRSRAFRENHEINFDKIGNDKEKYLNAIMTTVSTLQSYFEDLEKVIIFLKVDKSKIQGLYEEKLEVDDYYKYHYDNFIIRVVTSIDVCGKVGNVVYDLKIAERYANWYSFANHPVMKETEPATKLLEFSDFLESFKSLRHAKVHAGHNPQNRFDKIIFWEIFNKVIKKAPDTHDEILEEFTIQQIEEAVNELEEVISETARHTFEFLDTMTERLNTIIHE